MNAKEPTNPYAPPPSVDAKVDQDERFIDGLIWRDGDRLVIRTGASLPPRCFVSGQPTHCSVTVTQVWQPGWVYLLILAGILPYFFVSPFFSRHVRMRVPILRSLYASHVRSVNTGLKLMVAGTLLVFLGLLAGRMIPLLSSLFGIGIPVVLLGLFISSRQPLSLNVVKLEGEFLTLKDVHPDCLADLPPLNEQENSPQ